MFDVEVKTIFDRIEFSNTEETLSKEQSRIVAIFIALGVVMVAGLTTMPKIEQQQAQAKLNCNADMTTCSDGGSGGHFTTSSGLTVSGDHGGHTTSTSTDFTTAGSSRVHAATSSGLTIIQGNGGKLKYTCCSEQGCNGFTASGGGSNALLLYIVY